MNSEILKNRDGKKFKIKNIDVVLKEAGELNKIFSASARTAKSNNKISKS